MVVAKVYPRIPKGGTKHFLQHHSGSPGSTSTTVRHVRTPSGGIKHFLQHRSGLSESAAVPYLRAPRGGSSTSYSTTLGAQDPRQLHACTPRGGIERSLQHHPGNPDMGLKGARLMGQAPARPRQGAGWAQPGPGLGLAQARPGAHGAGPGQARGPCTLCAEYCCLYMAAGRRK